MFETISNFFLAIWSSIQSWVKLLGHAIMGLVDLFKAVPAALSVLTSSVSYLPAVLISFATLSISITVVYLILNREEGG